MSLETTALMAITWQKVDPFVNSWQRFSVGRAVAAKAEVG